MNIMRPLTLVSACLIATLLFPSLSYSQSASDIDVGDHQVPPGTVTSDDFFPISVWYSGGDARAPMLSEITPASREEWRRDLQQIKDLGYNTVRTWVDWSKSEPREGEYHFENLNLLFELAQDVGLKVFVQLYLDSAPEWIGNKYPEAYFTTQSGEKMIPQSAPGYSIDHPGVREAAARFMINVAKNASQYPNLFGWDVWSEPHLINWASAPWMDNAHFGFNSHTQERFREWLKEKYDNDIEALNASWYRTFEAWSDVEAPRLRTILSYTDYIDWRLFLYDKMAEDVRFRYDAIRSVDKEGIITAHASPVSLYESPFSGRSSNDDFMISDQLDYYGMSLYPKHNDPARHYDTWQIRTLVDFAYSANKERGGFQVGEFQSGQGTIGLTISNPVTPDNQREWLWSVIAGGAKGVHIYAFKPMSSGYESGGYGLMNVDGSVTERAKSTGEIAGLVNEHKEMFANSYPVDAEVALVYNPLGQMAGGFSSRNPAPRMHTNSLIGYYRFFSENNIPVEFIHRKDLEAGKVSQYKLVIVPMSLLFTEAAAEGLRNYVADGGHVVGEARLAWNDERGFAANALPGMGLSEVFGIREDKIRKEEEVAIRVADSGSPITSGLQAGDALQGAFYAESLERLPASNGAVDVLATFEDGTPAVTSSRYGDGEAMFIGSFLGLANQTLSGAAEQNSQLLENVTQWAGVQRPFTTSQREDAQLQVRLQQNKDTGDYLLFIINHNESEEEVAVSLNVEYLNVAAAEEILLSELTGDRQVRVRPSRDVTAIEATLPAKGVEVWHIQAQ